MFALAIAGSYANGLHIPFVFDDWHAIEQNPSIRSLANLPRFFVDPSTTTVLRENEDLRPLLLVTFAANYAVSGLNPWSYHLLNLLLHWIAVVLVFRIARDHFWLGDDALPVAATAALVVAVHPLNTEPVDYLSARSALLTTVFYLAAFDAAARGRGVVACLFEVLAMLTKAIAVTLPATLAVYWLLAGRQGPAPRRPRRRWWVVAALAAISVGGLLYRRLLLPPWIVETAHQPGITPWVYCMTEWSAYLYYLRLFLWPDALVVDRLDYPYAHSMGDARAWASLLGLAALGVGAWWVGRRRPAVGFAAAWCAITLAPESSFFPLAEPVNEHRPYLAMLGLGTLAALGIQSLATRLGAGRPGRRIFVGLTLLAVAALGTTTFVRNRVWQDDYALWLDATAKAPHNARAWLNAGHAAMRRGQLGTARRLLQEGHRLAPCYAYIQMNLSALDAREGQLDTSLAWAEDGVRCDPGLALAHYYEGAALERLSRFDEALAAYRVTTRIDVHHADAWLAQGRVLERRGAWQEAAAAYDRAFEANPTSVDAAMHGGLVRQYRLTDPKGAVERYRAVLELMPGHYGARYQLAAALLAGGEVAEARKAWAAFVPLAEAAGDRATLEGAPEALRRAGP